MGQVSPGALRGQRLGVGGRKLAGGPQRKHLEVIGQLGAAVSEMKGGARGKWLRRGRSVDWQAGEDDACPAKVCRSLRSQSVESKKSDSENISKEGKTW